MNTQIKRVLLGISNKNIMLNSVKILISNPIAKEGVKILKEAGFVVDVETELAQDELKAKIKDYDILVVRSKTKVTKEVIDSAKNLKLIARAGVGIDNIDIEYARNMGIAVMNSPAGVSNAVAELVVGLMLAVLRNIATADRLLRKHEWKKPQLLGRELTGKTVGIIGFGRIGQLIVTRLKGFECKFIAFDPFSSAEKMKEFGVVQAKELDELYKIADIITLHVPLNKKTQGMINKDAMQDMKDGVIIINASRGGIVNEDDLYDTIVSGKVGGAGIDTWQNEPPGDNKLLNLDTVVGTQHLGASTRDARRRASRDTANQIVAAFKENELTNVVNDITTLKNND